MKLAVVIPTHNEAATVGRVLQGLIDLKLPNVEKEILVVDDGSSDRTAEIARSKGVVVVSHLINRGLGGALGTGIEAALRRGADMVVTFDGDGQHAPEDLPKMIEPLLENRADVVIGSRMLQKGGMPWHRRIANRMANLFTWILFGVRTTDSQSGLRAFSRHTAGRISIVTNNYEVSSEICGEVGRHRLRLTEVPIKTIYTDYSLSKGQGLVMGLKTLLRLIVGIIGRQG